LALGAVGLLGVGYEIRLSSERRLTRLRLRLARDLHDELGSNLGSIALLSEVLAKQPSGHPEIVPELGRVARQTIESLRDIVWFLDPASENMDDTLMRLKETARIMLPAMPFDFRSVLVENAPKPSLELRRNLFPIFKEILHNVAKHSGAARVEILIQTTPTDFLLRIADNGKGFHETQVRPGNGLKNLRRRAADLGGTIAFEKGEASGVVVNLRVPLT